jgi:hypothetical protein
MKLKNTLLAVISSALLATNGHAVTYSDLDFFNGKLVTTANPLTGSFQISSQDNDGFFDLVGYNPLVEQIVDATATFSLVDDSLFWSDGPEAVTINLGYTTFVDSQAATILFAIGDVTGSALFDLQADGTLGYSIIARTGDFKAINGALLVDTRPSAVPDGGMTAMLLGIGFLGLCVLQRKFARGQ